MARPKKQDTEVKTTKTKTTKKEEVNVKVLDDKKSFKLETTAKGLPISACEELINACVDRRLTDVAAKTADIVVEQAAKSKYKLDAAITTAVISILFNVSLLTVLFLK